LVGVVRAVKRFATLGAVGAVLLSILGVSMMFANFDKAEGDNDDKGSEFTTKSIKGTWGFSGGVGYLVPPAVPEALPAVGIGIVSFDGTGECTVSNTVNLNGELFGPFSSDSCTYSVNPDGTGTSVAEFSAGPAPGEASVSFVISDHGRKLRFIRTDFVVASFEAEKQ
jgi:hypothetical protein